ncbi:urease accessory protein [Bradyrhizobium sp. S3.12.5]|uniref:urease accessory protein UreD n=1 Tax=Bradyrhizobium sp. S3.12.5 TaxID=3156386 RepID=UPI0033943C8F
MFETPNGSSTWTDGNARSAHSILRDADLERASGVGRIVFDGGKRAARVVNIYEKFPTRIMFPQISDDTAREAVLVNAAGGVTGGDRFDLDISAIGDARVAVTTQAAEKVYRALDEPARVSTRLKIRDTAKLAWLPQETIIFDRARIRRQIEIDLHSGTELMALEWLVLGRAAHAEEIRSGHIRDSWFVRRDGRLIWADSFFVSDCTFPHLSRKSLLSDRRTIGTLIYFGLDLDRRLETLRDAVQSQQCDTAVTMVGGLIVVRLASRGSSDLRGALTKMLHHFARELGPGPFRVPKMWSC